jgi:hypothetical protein
MADKKVTQLTALTAPANTDLLLIIDDPSGSPISKKIELEDIFGATAQTTFVSMNFGSTGNSTIAANTLTLDTALGLTVTRGVVINEDGADSDTRIESDNQSNMFYVDASNDAIGIMTNAPIDAIDVNSDSIRVRTAKTPASGDNSVVGWPVGRIAWDEDYLYIAANSTNIVRVALTAF